MAKDIHIEGEISTNWGNIISDLAAAKDATIYVNSGGGSVTEGFAMADAIRRHSATHTVDLIGTGVVASIATMVLLAGKKGHRKMTANSFMMIHNPTVQVGGDASVLRGYADTLESMTAKIVQCYFDVIASNSKLINNSETETKAQIAKWMDAETWFTAQQALEAGLIDAVVEASDYDTATIKNYCKAYTIPQAILQDMEHTKEERTLFQKFLDFFRNTAKDECEPEKEPISESTNTVENMTDEQMIEALKAKGYSIEVEQEEMTEEEMVAALAANGKKVTKAEAMAEEKVEEKVEVKAENKYQNELQAMKEEIARLKLANKAPKIENKAEPVKGETRREQAMNQFVAENKGKLEAIAQKIKGSL